MNLDTNSYTPLYHPLPPQGSRAVSTLHTGGLVLLPTDNLWQLTAAVNQPAAVEKLLRTCPDATNNRPELIFADRDTLWSWCPRIPPRLDTLLIYHKRPVTLLVPAGPRVPLRLVDHNGEVAVRLASDSFCYRLCEDLEAPLVACLAMGQGTPGLPVSFGKIQSDVLRAADHTVARRIREVIGEQPAVTVRLNGEELEFLRS